MSGFFQRKFNSALFQMGHVQARSRSIPSLVYLLWFPPLLQITCAADGFNSRKLNQLAAFGPHACAAKFIFPFALPQGSPLRATDVPASIVESLSTSSNDLANRCWHGLNCKRSRYS